MLQETVETMLFFSLKDSRTDNLFLAKVAMEYNIGTSIKIAA